MKTPMQSAEAEPPASHGYFVAGTDTGVGKTLVACALVLALRESGRKVAVMKPVAAGASWSEGAWRNEDVDALLDASTLALPAELVCPYLLREATAPHLAAASEGVLLDLAHIERCFHSLSRLGDSIVVEGAGGYLVPLDHRHGMDELACRLGLPVILVVGIRLGCISHALLSVQAILARGQALAGWVASILDPGMPHQQATIESLRQRISAPLLACVPWIDDAGDRLAMAAGLLACQSADV